MNPLGIDCNGVPMPPPHVHCPRCGRMAPDYRDTQDRPGDLAECFCGIVVQGERDAMIRFDTTGALHCLHCHLTVFGATPAEKPAVQANENGNNWERRLAARKGQR